MDAETCSQRAHHIRPIPFDLGKAQVITSGIDPHKSPTPLSPLTPPDTNSPSDALSSTRELSARCFAVNGSKGRGLPSTLATSLSGALIRDRRQWTQ
ncbi:hypothetical protein ABTY96_37215 [Streptomyces sp. NPDC096057]|uniref:hypothetical protein n=1 Tax=Streptomyces sp. NPDC096057 TaxID=3155543 RepID=UPI00332AEB56